MSSTKKQQNIQSRFKPKNVAKLASLSQKRHRIPFKEAFRDWVLLNIATGSDKKKSKVASDYCSRLGRLHEDIFKVIDIADYFAFIPKLLCYKSGPNDVLNLLSAYQSALSTNRDNIKEKCSLTSAGFSSLQSSLVAYSAFISDFTCFDDERTEENNKFVVDDVTENDLPGKKIISSLKAQTQKISISKEKKTEIKEFIEKNKKNAIFTKSVLSKTFRLRLLTQDRLWGGYQVYFPIRLINKIFHEFGQNENEKETAIKWAEKIVDNIIILTGTDTEKKLNQISKLTITDKGEVFVDKETDVYTEMNDHDQPYQKMNGVNSMRDIAIDHVNPIFNELQNIANYPGLTILTKIYNCIRGDNDKRPKIDLATLMDKVNENVNDKSSLLSMLKNELESINTGVKGYRLMSQKENISKGKGPN